MTGNDVYKRVIIQRIICKNGNISYHATKRLHRYGYHVVNVIGGIDHFRGRVKTKYI